MNRAFDAGFRSAVERIKSRSWAKLEQDFHAEADLDRAVASRQKQNAVPGDAGVMSVIIKVQRALMEEKLTNPMQMPVPQNLLQIRQQNRQSHHSARSSSVPWTNMSRASLARAQLTPAAKVSGKAKESTVDLYGLAAGRTVQSVSTQKCGLQ